MDTEQLSMGNCPVGRGLARVGDTWSALVLRDASFGMTKFEQFRVSLGISPNILTARLKALTQAGLLEKRRYSQHPPRDEYVLTQSGRDFIPVLHMIGCWASKHHGEGLVNRLIDATTGVEVKVTFIDEISGQPLENRPLKIGSPQA